MNSHDSIDARVAAPAEADRERARADAAEGRATLQCASLAELAEDVEELRCQIADLTNDVYTLFRDKPCPPHGLRYVTERMNHLADRLARAAAGYAQARTSDMAIVRSWRISPPMAGRRAPTTN